MITLQFSCLHAGKSQNPIIQKNSHEVIYFVYIYKNNWGANGMIFERSDW